MHVLCHGSESRQARNARGLVALLSWASMCLQRIQRLHVWRMSMTGRRSSAKSWLQRSTCDGAEPRCRLMREGRAGGEGRRQEKSWHQRTAFQCHPDGAFLLVALIHLVELVEKWIVGKLHH